MLDDPYAKTTGILQAYCMSAAISIESIVRNFPMDEWAKSELLETAAKLRTANRAVEAVVAKYELGEAA